MLVNKFFKLSITNRIWNTNFMYTLFDKISQIKGNNISAIHIQSYQTKMLDLLSMWIKGNTSFKST